MMSFYDGSLLLNCTGADAAVIAVGEDRIYSSGFTLSALISRLPPDITIGDCTTNSIKIYSISGLEKIIQDKRIYDFFKKLGNWRNSKNNGKGLFMWKLIVTVRM